MKKIVLCVLILCCASWVKAQEYIGVNRSIWEIQGTILGTYLHNESRLAKSITLRTEVGLDMGEWYDSHGTYNTSFVIVPALTLEPRYYYNLNKRHAKSKRIDNNSGNFLAFKIECRSGIIPNDKSITNTHGDISFTPMWGLRRHFKKINFNYELGGGIRYRYWFNNSGEFLPFIHLRVGYTF